MLLCAFTARCRLPAAVRINSLCVSLSTAHRSVKAGQAVSSSFSVFVRTLKTFIPFAGSTPEEGVLRSLIALDDKRLGKQRVESQCNNSNVDGDTAANTNTGTRHRLTVRSLCCRLCVVFSVSDMEDGPRAAIRQHQASGRSSVAQAGGVVQAPSSQHVDGVSHQRTLTHHSTGWHHQLISLAVCNVSLLVFPRTVIPTPSLSTF